MITKVPLIHPDECAHILEDLKGLTWEDGFVGDEQYRQVKDNQELSLGKGADEHLQWIIQMLMQSSDFGRKTIPANLTGARFNRYTDGGQYKLHSDSAFMGSQPEIRTDFSMTLFLSDPATYDGGELVLCYSGGMRIELKEPAGTLVFYPSGVPHGVNPVTAGERIAFVAWVESHVQDAAKRDILVDISQLCEDLKNRDAYSVEHTLATSIRHNLYRMWLKRA